MKIAIHILATSDIEPNIFRMVLANVQSFVKTKTDKECNCGDAKTVKERNGQVYKGIAGSFFVKADEKMIVCQARGRLKSAGEIFIGDYVKIFDYGNGTGSIEKILPRKNQLVRPYVSNVDAILIVIALLPKPDFLLVDKLLIYCLQENIKAIICVNKSDLDDGQFAKSVRAEYENAADVISVSSFDKSNIENLRKAMSGLFVCFAGQSAVGKSSIINSIDEGICLEVGDLSQKSKRGKHTTRVVEIFEFMGGIKIADTCGFSSLEVPKLSPEALSSFYIDFNEYSLKCRFRGCNHILEPDCAVREAVAANKISKERYERYKALYEETKENWRNRYE